MTNLARTIGDMKGRGIWLIGADGSAKESVYKAKLEGQWAWSWARTWRAWLK